MGKMRIKTIGDEEREKREARDAKKRADAKLVETLKESRRPDDTENQSTNQVENSMKALQKAPAGKESKKEKLRKKTRGSLRSKSYQTKAALVDRAKAYSLEDAIQLLPQLKRAKFDETVELHLTTTETGISGSVSLPHGTGKHIRIAIARGDNQKELDDLLKRIEAGSIDFDILIATPDAMPKLARVARILGPRGLMPNPKAGTVTTTPEEVAKNYEAGQINFKTEAKFPLLHIAVGKVSFGADKIRDNVKTVLQAIDKKKIKNATLKSTMSPGIHLDIASL